MNPSSPRKRPSVIIILSDDQGYGDFSCHGNPVLRTPNFDRLHGQSVRFTDFHVAPMCTPTRGQLMTGLDALRNGATAVFGGRTFIRQGIPTMAEVFAESGYRTGLFGKWHLGENYPFRPEDRGFQETVYFPSASVTSAPDYWNNDFFDDHYRHNGQVRQFQGYSTDVFFNQAMEWMRQCQQEGKPFFTYLATGADHMPYFVPDHYREPYRHLNIYLASFFAMVANYDENIGRLEEFLSQTGLREDTIVVFMTDNGAVVSVDLFNAGMREGKCSLYDGGHRVPCFVRWPAGGLVSPRDIAQPAHCQDWMPTLIELCGLRGDLVSDGDSLAGVLRDPQARLPDRMLVVQYGDEPHQHKYHATVIWDQWRLVRNKQLYHIGKDPGQQHDVAEAHPEVLQSMQAHYERWWQGLGEIAALERIRIGSDRENPISLSHLDWRGPFLNYQTQIRSLQSFRASPQEIKGPWNLHVEQAGDYEITLRRWPVEANAPIAGGLPEFIPTDRTFYHVPQPGPEAAQMKWAWIGAASQPGKALPIAAARCQIAGYDQTIPVVSQDTAAVFRMALAAGPVTLGTWFHDAQGRELCGAFYVSVRRLGA